MTPSTDLFVQGSDSASSRSQEIELVSPQGASKTSKPLEALEDDLSDRADSQFAGRWSVGQNLPPAERRALLAQVAAALHGLGYGKAVKSLLSGRAGISLSEGTLPASLGAQPNAQGSSIQFASGGFVHPN
jgi:hypothetical protein